MILLVFMTICVAIWMMVHIMLTSDIKYDRARRMFKIPRPIKILCHYHTAKLKKGQVALIDPNRCIKCSVDNKGKP